MDRDRDGVAADSFCGLQLHHVRGHDLAGHDVIREDATELLFVLRLEQRLERTLGQLRKRLVGRREYRDWALALQCGNEPGSVKSFCERLERAGRDGRVDDVSGLGAYRARAR